MGKLFAMSAIDIVLSIVIVTISNDKKRCDLKWI